MKRIKDSFLIYHVGAQAFAQSEASKNISMIWNHENNCGPRPNGLMYPRPRVSTGDFTDNHECDIMDNAYYVSGYRCRAPCQAAPDTQVVLVCNCHEEMGKIHFVKQCTWEFPLGECPAVPESAPKFDWECNPLTQDCTQGQYPPTDQSDNRTLPPASEPLSSEEASDTAVHSLLHKVVENMVQNSSNEPKEHKRNNKQTNRHVHTTSSPPTTEDSWTTEELQDASLFEDDAVNVAVEILEQVMALQREHEQLADELDYATTEASTTTTPAAPVMLNDVTEETSNDQPVYEYEDNDEDTYEEDYYQKFVPRGRPINNIVNFFNDGSPPSVALPIEGGGGRVQVAPGPRSYPRQFQHDAVGSANGFYKEPSEPAIDIFKLKKRLDKSKSEVAALKKALAEQEAIHQDLKNFVAKSLKVEVDDKLLELIK